MKRHMSDVLFVLTLFCVFTLSSLSVVYVGLQVYKQTTQTMETQYTFYTSCQYIIEKVRQNNSRDCLDIIQLDGMDILRITQDYQGEKYYTYIYQSDNYLKELFIHSDDEPHFNEGDNIIALKQLNMKMVQDDLLYLDFQSTNHQSQSIYISIL